MTYKKRPSAARSRAALSGGVALSVILLGSTAVAVAPAAAQDGSRVLEEVVVTARYTRENLQQTPLAITAITGENLKAASLDNVTDLGATAPNLFIHPGDAAEGPTPTISMRGVSQGDYNFTYEPAVGIYVDDVYHNTLFGSALDLMDVDRVEVLRGPQGTLFGNSSIGGAIRIFSKKPEGGNYGHIEATYGSFNRQDLSGSFDTALADNLFLRISGVSKKKDGYVDILDFTCEMDRQGTPELAGSFPTQRNSTPQNGCKVGTNGGTDLHATRAMLRYVASDRLELNFSAAYSKEVDESAPEVLIDAHPSTTDGFASAYNDMIFDTYGIRYDNRFLPPADKPYSNYSVYTSVFRNHTYPNENRQRSADFSGSVDWDVADNVHLKGIVSHSEYGGAYTQDAGEDPFDISIAYGTFDVHQSTAEVRLTGNLLDDKLEWATGLFALRANEHLGGDIDYVTLSWAVNDVVKAENESGFLHLVYHLTDKLSLEGGGRYTSVRKSYLFNHPGLLVIDAPSKLQEHHVDWLANISYQVTDDALVYAKASTGFRPGGIFARPVTVAQLRPFAGEELTAYEIGSKTELFDGRLRLNLAAFYSDYGKHLTTRSDYQCLGQTNPSPVVDPAVCPPGGYVTWGVNTTTPATIKGVELEAIYEPIQGLRLSLSGGYHDFESRVHTPGEPGYIYPGNIGQPEFNASGSIQYTMNALGGILTPRLDWFHQSHQTNGPSATTAPPDPDYILPSRSTFNARISYTPDDSQWTVSLSGTNLTDKYYYYNLFSGSGFALSGNAAPPREFAITARRNF